MMFRQQVFVEIVPFINGWPALYVFGSKSCLEQQLLVSE